VSIEAKAQAFLSELEDQLVHRTQILSEFVDHLASLAGRKHVVFFSSGWLLTPGWHIADAVESFIDPDPTVDANYLNSYLSLQDFVFVPYVNSLIDRANRAQVTFYGIDARGLAGSLSGAERRLRDQGLLMSGLYTAMAREDISDPEELLASLSRGTGGRPLLWSNDLEEGIIRAYQDSQNYYLLGYSPRRDEKYQGKRLHRIQIRVSRPDVRLRYRKGYVAADATEESSSDLFAAVRFPEIFDDFPVHVRTAIKNGRLWITSAIPTHSLNFYSQRGHFRCPIQVSYGLWDREGQLLGSGLFTEKADLDLSKEELETLRKSPGITSAAERQLDAGSYRLVVVVQQGIPSLIGTWVGQVQIE
jgi:hypothetical protein